MKAAPTQRTGNILVAFFFLFFLSPSPAGTQQQTESHQTSSQPVNPLQKLQRDLAEFWELSSLYSILDPEEDAFPDDFQQLESIESSHSIIPCGWEQCREVVLRDHCGLERPDDEHSSGVFLASYDFNLIEGVAASGGLSKKRPWFVRAPAEREALLAHTGLRLDSLLFLFEEVEGESSGVAWNLLEAYALMGGEVMVREIGNWTLERGVKLGVIFTLNPVRVPTFDWL